MTVTRTAEPRAKPRPRLVVSFIRAQLSSITATVVDFGVMFTMVEVFGWWYVAGTATGALCGAVTNFTLGRHWTFLATHARAHRQAPRYALVSVASLLLNSAGVYLFTESAGLRYGFSRAIVAVAVAVLFNFPLQRGFVFR